LVGIVGPRGVGKTTLLLQHLREIDPNDDTVLYLSADSILLGRSSLFEFAQAFHHQKGGTTLFIDDVHRCKDWSIELKTIYDSLPKLKVIFSGSSQMHLMKGRGDLSRRALFYQMPGLSFREYLRLENIYSTHAFSVEDLVENFISITNEITQSLSVLKYFHEYLEWRYYPYYRKVRDKATYYRQILNTIDKTIFEDVALSTNVYCPPMKLSG
jgi:predicted AAA+ superfamily ATPase